MTKAIYALSGDPITYGHIDLIKRSSMMFDKVIVGIGDNPEKKYLFNKDKRVEMAKKALLGFNNVEVLSFSGLLVDFAHSKNVKVIVRGIRNVKDLEDENTLYQINSTLDEDIETTLLFTKPELSKVSSSAVKAIQKECGDISSYTPLNVKESMEKAISGYILIGVTGLMGSGKSWVAKELESYSKDKDIIVTNIELDDIAKDILYESTEDSSLLIREKLKEKFKTLNKKEIAEKIFNNDEESLSNLSFINNLIRKPLLIAIRRKLKDTKGIILINSAILIESDMLDYVNNNLIYVETEDNQRFELLEKNRGYDRNQAKKRLESVLSKEDKLDKYNENKLKRQNGKLIIYENLINEENDKSIKILYENIIEIYNNK